MATAEKVPFYRMIWRWHFYAGLFVMPFILILSVTGAIYLFKPDLDRWEERGFHGNAPGRAALPSAQVDAALAAFPGAQFHSYRLPVNAGDAVAVHVGLADGQTMRDVFVSPDGKVLGSIDPEARISAIVSRIHGELLIGRAGDLLVELAASWAIVMILTGLYLWWPEGRGLAGVVWPRLALRGRAFWRDLHAVTGFWVAGLALVLLVSGLPWASVWGDAFRVVRAEMGWVKGAQNWKTGGHHAEHDHNAMMRQQAAGIPLASLDDIVVKARDENLANPVMVKPPGAPEKFGPPSPMAWTVKSESQNRPINRTITFDAATGKELSRASFADKHPVDRIVNYGIAWHEGQLLGRFNQAVGVFTALSLITLAISGFLMWRRRKPDHRLGAPPEPDLPVRIRGVAVIILVLAALLPLLAASLILLWLVDRLILPQFPRVSRWLGVEREREFG